VRMNQRLASDVVEKWRARKFVWDEEMETEEKP